jgi:hypothetical protein
MVLFRLDGLPVSGEDESERIVRTYERKMYERKMKVNPLKTGKKP